MARGEGGLNASNDTQISSVGLKSFGSLDHQYQYHPMDNPMVDGVLTLTVSNVQLAFGSDLVEQQVV